MKRINFILIGLLISITSFGQFYNAKEYRLVNKTDSVGISGVGQIRWNAATGKFRFWNGTSWFSYPTIGLTNGDKGDITVSSSGTVWSLDASSISFATGTTGTTVNWSSSPISLGGTATLNIPDASTTARGVVTTGTQTFAGAKIFSTTVETGGDFKSVIGANTIRIGIGSYGLGGGTAGVLGTDTSTPIIFAVNAIEKARLSTAGYLGIGVNPSVKLHVANITDGVIAQFDGGASGFGTFLSHDANGAHFYTNSTGRGFTFGSNFSLTQFTLATTGVGTATDWVATSDRRLKKNIHPVGSQLQKVVSIAKLVKNYDRKDNGKNETGFVAQELYKVAPEYVNVPEDNGEMMGVNYAKMVVPLYAAIAELTKRLEVLENENAGLKRRRRDFENEFYKADSTFNAITK